MPDSVLHPAPVRTKRRAWCAMKACSAARWPRAPSGAAMPGEIARKVGLGRTENLEDRLALSVRELRHSGFRILIDISVEHDRIEALRQFARRRIGLAASGENIFKARVEVILRVLGQGIERARIDEIAQRIFEQPRLEVEI